jgi:predicted PurR-regulated permease PerM
VPGTSNQPREGRRSATGSASARPEAFRRHHPLIVLAAAVLVVACLYLAQKLLMPIALAILLTFLLSPAVTFLQRHGAGRALSVLVVVILVFALLGGLGWVLVTQVISLGDELPQYKDNIKQKIADLRWVGRGGSLEKAWETVRRAAGEVEKETAGRGPRVPPAPKPTPVIVHADRSTEIWSLPTAVVPWVEPLATAALVVVLVVFMLLERQALRNRLIRLAGSGRLAVTTKALDEAAGRISRYLLMQSAVNTTFGLAIGLGLFAIGVPFPFVWGFLAGVLRFVPYVGAWVGASMPIALSLAVFTGWTKPLLVAALFVVIEPLIGMMLEPLLYANTAGVSEVALLVAVAFWTWIWGPIGLVVATPLTVCLVVVSKYVPALDFVTVLMADAPALEPHVAYYQRLLAMDQDEATDLVEAQLRSQPLAHVYDRFLLPALALTKRDCALGRLDDDNARFVFRATREILDDLALRPPPPDAGDRSRPPATAPTVRVVGCPANDTADELALEMLRHLLDPARCDLEVLSADLLMSEIVSAAAGPGAGERCDVACISALSPGGTARARYLCKRLRARFPTAKIVVGRWGLDEGVEHARELLRAASADEMATSLLQARDHIAALCQARVELVQQIA